VDRQEEPLALADEGGILAAVAGRALETLAGLGGLDLSRLEGFLGLADGADRSGFGDAGDSSPSASQYVACFIRSFIDPVTERSSALANRTEAAAGTMSRW
jgi:hypothetical protein